jgi:hypothetical protein
VIVSFLFSSSIVLAETFKTLAPQKEDDVSQKYFLHILKRSLEVTSTEVPANINFEFLPHRGQKRSIKQLESGEYYDVLWSANSPERNVKLDYVPFPLFKGLLGKRGFVIRPDRLTEFSGISDVEALKKFRICQGRGWPDTQILRRNGFEVTEVTYFDDMLKMVELNRCDAITLSVLEGPEEILGLKENPNKLIFWSDVILSYDLVMNFYLPKSRKKLTKRIYDGLLILDESGEFEQIMQTQKLTHETIKMLNQEERIVFELPAHPKDLIEK